MVARNSTSLGNGQSNQIDIFSEKKKKQLQKQSRCFLLISIIR